ncbi:hypothetical protein EOD41_00110 [Mucilaginibacter limnophilus]|uniref:Uncharacterized protein n=1 Tax=Mucilaginibacter limnophilus TaxID=1932778 RepID=A0A3S2Y330_9SPHI|nr:hypothetical protein [Mucilaginibacter limnophilus]RVU02380.1 hypothetical protein EOD41_00110 [Mucilaginibacter limnophilus]
MNVDNVKRRKINQAVNFLEELSWLLDSKRNFDLKEVSKLIRSLTESDIQSDISTKYSSVNQNKNILVGILPNLFLDQDLFKSNSDLTEFSESVLHIIIPRFEKRSRYEIIGLIVCAVPDLDDSALSNLVEALTLITGNKDKLKQVKAEKNKVNFSWNDTIHNLNKS